MGVWANGPDPRGNVVDVEGIAEVMRPVLYGWFSAHIQLIDPNRLAATAYSATADTGGTATPQLVLDSGVNGALIQPVRSASRLDAGGQPNALLGIRFQLKAEPSASETLRAGLRVKVLDGGNSPDLVNYFFSLSEAIDSSLRWGRIFDAVVLTGGV